MLNATLSKIRIYPVKSLDPVELHESEIGKMSLKYDREFALMAADGGFINGKRTGKVNELKAEYDLPKYIIRLQPRTGGEEKIFHLIHDKLRIEEYISEFFGMKTELLHRTSGELMDMPGESGVTVVSNSSLETILQGFPNLDISDIRLRFRANLEITGVDAFWEESLFSEQGYGVLFTIGDVELVGISPRARCNVPPRNPMTGELDRTFVKTMIETRKKTLPIESRIPNFGSLYHLTVNVYVPETEFGKKIRVGDPIRVIREVKIS